jgi:predicted dehydrogenase
MRFALLGTHPDGLEMASALVESGRHQLVVHTAAAASVEYRQRWGAEARSVSDLEEVLADPDVEMVLVAGSPANRPIQLRRALQSERHVLCVYPPDQTPDLAYEAAMIQGDTHKVLLPILPQALHPGIVRLAQMFRDTDGSLGIAHLLDLEQRASEQVLLGGAMEHKPCFPGWDVLRAVGGEIAEVSAFARSEVITTDEPVLVQGRFEKGVLFRASYLRQRPGPRWRLTALGSRGQVELLFPHGWEGPAFLSYHDEADELHEEAWDTWDPWPGMVTWFETALAKASTTEAVKPSWQDVLRGLELDDAARRSIERRRASVLEYPEPNEEVGFKGTMTLLGCGLLWALFLLLLVANWYPMLFWAVAPLLALFLGLQLLRWIVPARNQPPGPSDRRL